MIWAIGSKCEQEVLVYFLIVVQEVLQYNSDVFFVEDPFEIEISIFFLHDIVSEVCVCFLKIL